MTRLVERKTGYLVGNRIGEFRFTVCQLLFPGGLQFWQISLSRFHVAKDAFHFKIPAIQPPLEFGVGRGQSGGKLRRVDVPLLQCPQRSTVYSRIRIQTIQFLQLICDLVAFSGHQRRSVRAP